MSKRKRQEAILSIIAKHPVSTQEELVERLQRAGIATTQATVSPARRVPYKCRSSGRRVKARLKSPSKP